jgi:PIN domain nuclease of toxin-antitoxin system
LKLLLDTHIALWAVEDNPRLTRAARDIINAAQSELFVSVVSLWEIAIKHTLVRGKQSMPMPVSDAQRYFAASGFEIVPATAAHVMALEDLPRLHGDPFDRLIVATSLSEPFRLVTHDQQLAAYGPTIIVV